VPFEVNSRWYGGACSILSYELNELQGTKLRALYQRKKGRIPGRGSVTREPLPATGQRVRLGKTQDE
jgi:hypothetical protein